MYWQSLYRKNNCSGQGAKATLTLQENELLTRVGPWSPAGEFLRLYRQPIARCEELPQGGAPIPIKILGEDMVLFRDDKGRVGLLGLN